MRIYRLESDTWVPRPLDEVFAFHGDPANLQTVTPPFLNFQILTPAPIAMRAGTVIEYKIRLRGIPVRWRTEITAWDPPRRFVDEQRRGPYRLWIHEHTFEGRDGGTTIRDRVRYAVPLGALVHGWAVAPDVRRIFTFRHETLLRLFGGSIETQPAKITIAREKQG